MKIVQFTAENIKKLKVVHIKPNGNVVQLTGANGQGKTSVLDAIYYALAGTKNLPSQPVRKGAGKGFVTLDLDEIKVTRKFTEAGGTQLFVEAKNGARFPSPQSMLDDLLGKLTFDPLAFTRMDSKQQLETLKGLVDLGGVNVDELDKQNKTDYDRRTEVNRRVKQITAQIDAITIPDGLPAKQIDVTALTTKLAQAGDHNSSVDNEARKREVQANTMKDMRNKVEQLRAEADRIEKLADGIDAEIKAYAPLAAKIDTAALAQEIEKARQTNAQIDRRDVRKGLESDLKDAQAEAEELTKAMEDRAQQKTNAIAQAKMPLEGLSFGDGEVIFNTLPLNQASDAEQLRISVAIAMAANPKLRVLRIRDGSLLDENSLQIIAEMADAKDYQVWIERVDTSGKVGVVMEDGCVKQTAPAEPEQEAAKPEKKEKKAAK